MQCYVITTALSRDKFTRYVASTPPSTSPWKNSGTGFNVITISKLVYRIREGRRTFQGELTLFAITLEPGIDGTRGTSGMGRKYS